MIEAFLIVIYKIEFLIKYSYLKPNSYYFLYIMSLDFDNKEAILLFANLKIFSFYTDNSIHLLHTHIFHPHI